MAKTEPAQPSNPYINAGQIASGPRFVGRQVDLELLSNMWRGTRPGNASIVGLHRTGKSSIVRRCADQGGAGTNVVALVNVGAIDGGVGLVRSLCKATFRALSSSPQGTDKTERLRPWLTALLEWEQWIDCLEAAYDFFHEVASIDTGVVLALDEFDRMSAFAGVREFQLLRDLCSEPAFNVGLTTVSRRAIAEIEQDCDGGVGGSHLSAVMGQWQRVGLFTDDEISTVLDRGSVLDHWGTAEMELITLGAGGHPYCLELACSVVWDRCAAGDVVDWSSVRDTLLPSLRQLFNRYCEPLRQADSSALGRLRDSLISDGSVALEDVPPVLLDLFVTLGDGSAGPFGALFHEFLVSDGVH